MSIYSFFSFRVLLLIFGLVFISTILVAQNSSEDQSGINLGKLGTFNVEQISSSSWNTLDGLPQKQVPGSNLGTASFEILDSNRIAFLSNASNEIIIVDINTGKSIFKFNVEFSPRDFVYDSGRFYVLNDYKINIYDNEGKLIRSKDFDRSVLSVVRLTRYMNSTYLLLPDGNSYLVDSDDSHVPTSKIFNGWITSTGNRIETRINGDNTYTIAVYTLKGQKFETTFTEDKIVAGVFVVGNTDDRVLIDVQNYISEDPIQIERKLVSVTFDKYGKGQISAEIKIPNVYFVLSNKDFLLAPSGTIFNMITSPEGVFVFKLSETILHSGDGTYYPEFISKRNFHFNTDLRSND